MYGNFQICEDDNDDSYVVDRTGRVDIGRIQDHKPEGNRVVDISFFLKEMRGLRRIRNKFCTVCDMTERKNVKAKVHKCYKNFDGNASSTSMESDIIVEGFKNSIEMHGLIYRTVIADGDSNVFKSIIDNRPYQEQMITVSKIECTNHLLRNLCKKLKVISETTEPKICVEIVFI
ncbi:hypothetical protein ALC57_15649 [Trachymyrmex cornetzi]|uniref:Mutator-like transposase domain-containing protein n=1 Tax=Trachymyrmex cornetzi TaxID=471704 RepID=A0A151IWM8_9HYME|nr:hypothetical protein ALC57_15649 [Trachymyrmex cornetzi]